MSGQRAMKQNLAPPPGPLRVCENSAKKIFFDHILQKSSRLCSRFRYWIPGTDPDPEYLIPIPNTQSRSRIPDPDPEYPIPNTRSRSRIPDPNPEYPIPIPNTRSRSRIANPDPDPEYPIPIPGFCEHSLEDFCRMWSKNIFFAESSHTRRGPGGG